MTAATCWIGTRFAALSCRRKRVRDDQFFWDGTNVREDAYGSKELSGRARFAADILRAVRRAVGPDFPIIIRVSQWKQQDFAVKLAHDPKTLEAWLGALVEEFRPDELLVGSVLDRHADHHAVGQAARRLLSAGGLGCRVAEYPMGFWRTMPWRSRPRGVHRVAGSFLRGAATIAHLRPELVRTEGYLERKRHALDAYASQLTNLTGEAGWWTLDGPFLAQFLGRHEVFLPVTRW